VWRNEVIQKNTHDERQPNPNRERDGEAGDFNSSYQEQVSYVKDCTSEKRENNMSGIGVMDIIDEREWPSASAPEGKPPKKTRHDNPQYVIPIQQLERPARSEFHGVGP
jgi:hypothetical protein